MIDNRRVMAYIGRVKRPPLGVKRWPFVSLSIRAEHLAEWTSLARQLGRSRSELLRETLYRLGLPYARALAEARAATDGDGAKGGRE